MSEEWRPIPGYPGYEVSDEGRVKSFRRYRTGRVLSPEIKKTGGKGYRRLLLMVDRRPLHRSVHELVLLAFVGPRPEGMLIRHLDGDPANNRPANLRYGTSVENVADRIAHGRDANTNKTRCASGHPYAGPNLYVDPSGARHCRTCTRASVDRRRLRRMKAAA